MCVRFQKKKTALWRKNMIAFIKGTVDSLSEGKMILESHGIGYELNTAYDSMKQQQYDELNKYGELKSFGANAIQN